MWRRSRQVQWMENRRDYQN